MFTRKPIFSIAIGVMISAIALSSCKKDNEEPQPVTPTNPVQATFYHQPITNGSYWIYVEENTDSLGNVTTTGGNDSVYVAGDTVIGTTTYKKIVSVQLAGGHYFPNIPVTCKRDSAGYLVDQSGNFIRINDFTDTLYNANVGGLIDEYYFMRHPDSTVTVPAGSFQTVDYEGHVYATSPSTYPHPSPRFTHTLYADQIGLIMEVKYFYSASGYTQKRLVAYHIN